MTDDAKTIGEKPAWVPTPTEIRFIVSGLVVAVFVSSLDQTILAGSLSSIAADLNDWSSASWLVSGYLIASIIATPIAGRMSDLFGRRRLLFGLALAYIAGSILCATMWSMYSLIACRILQGIGAGGLRAVAMSTMSDLVSPRERGRYQVYFSSAFAISSLSGPVVGGFLSGTTGWRGVFWLSAGLGVLALALTYHQLRKLAIPAKPSSIDWLGSILIAGFAYALVTFLNEAQHSGWTNSHALAYAVASAVALAILVWVSRKKDAPMFPVQLFAQPVFSASCMITLLSSMVMTGTIVTLPLIYTAFGFDPKTVGVMLIPVTLGVVTGSFVSGQAVLRTGRYRPCPIIGCIAGSLICAAMSALLSPDRLAVIITLTGFLGLAFGFQLAPLTVAVQNAVALKDAGAGMSALLFFRLLGGAAGVALLTDAFLARLPSGTLEAARTALPAADLSLMATISSAASTTTTIGAATMLLAFIVSLALREIPLRTENV